MLRRVWAKRWVRAVLAAALLAVWPAWMLLQPHDREETSRANLDFVLKDMDGREVNLADFEGRPLLVNFWATWCGPCKHEIPVFVDLVERYREQQFTVVGISVDDTPEELREFAKTYGMNYPVLVGKGRDDVLEAYAAGFFLPTSWFIRRDGTVANKHAGSQTREWFEAQVGALVRDSEPVEAP
jgi:thiol-disulfide isomerase/thioredoxin